MSLKHMQRYTDKLIECPFGPVFWEFFDHQVNTSKLKLIMSSVDTVRQLYKSKINPLWLDKFESCIATSRSEVHKFTVSGHDFLLGSGGASRYQYRLQNNELGLIILVKSSLAKADSYATHVKIECSPTLLLRRSPEYVQDMMDSIVAELTIGEFSHKGVAIHLAVDFQGWDVRKDFSNNLRCRSSLRVVRDGIQNAEVTLSDVSVSYGGSQSMTFGSPKAIQMALYDKDKQIKKVDKTDFFKAAWGGQFGTCDSGDKYDDEAGVRRLEMRFHHSVINEFHEGLHRSKIGTGEMRSYKGVSLHLGDLWQYAMSQFESPDEFYEDWTCPFWGKLAQDSNFVKFDSDYVHKRVRKESCGDIAKNIGLAMGNIISIAARNKATVAQIMTMIRGSCIYEDVIKYFRDKGFGKDEFHKWISDALIKRRMFGNAA